MKKIILFLFILFFIFSCGKNNKETKVEYKDLEGYTLTSFNTMNALERIELEKKLDISGSKITYYNEPSSYGANTEEEKTTIIKEDDRPFEIVDYSPVNELPSEVKIPTIYVAFSHPVVPLAKLGEVIKTTDLMKIEPEITGVYRWYGTSILSFEPDTSLMPQRIYKVTINDKIQSLGGKNLTGMKEFSFSTENLGVISTNPSGSEISLENAKKILITFNYQVNVNVIKNFIKITSNKKEYTFDIKMYEKDSTNKTVVLDVKENFSENSTVYITIVKGAKSDENFTPTKTDLQYSFTTISPFVYNGYDTYNYYGAEKDDSNPIFLSFSHPLNEETVYNNIKISLSVTSIKDYVKVWNNTIKITNLPVKFNSTYTVTIKDGIKDIYGRNLGITKEESVYVPDAASLYYFPNTGVKMLESSFKPKIIYEMQNLNRGLWKIDKIDNPYNFFNKNELSNYDMSKLQRNVKHFEILDLSPYLNKEGKGFVGMSWNFDQGELPYEMERKEFDDIVNNSEKELSILLSQAYYTNNNSDKYYLNYDFSYGERMNLKRLLIESGYQFPYSEYTKTNLNLQVTDLGASVRYGYNKIVVMVSSLSKGEPVADAKVIIQKNTSRVKEAKTNKDGIATIDFKEGEFASNFYDDYRELLRVRVEKGADKIEFDPNDCEQNAYHFSIYPSSAKTIEASNRVTFLFTDRGLYKPGETVTFRGIDKNLKLSKYSDYVGEYTIKVASDYYSQNPITTITGKTTESGGFYGTFKLPDGIEPGYYWINYKRPNDTYGQSESFQIANFRRLNFQVKMSPPKVEIYQDEDINVGVLASYLSGGTLAGAGYEYYWFREGAYFRPEGSKWEPYVFGNYEYDSRVDLDSGSGKLGASGNASIKQSTKGSMVKGLTYAYNVSVNVTDIDRQVISGGSRIIVHPASFYTGLKFKSNDSYWSTFVKKGDKIDVDYALVKPDGSLYEGVGKNSKLNLKVVKYEWKLAQQEGVYDRLNTIYDKVEELESETSVNISANIGTFSITPKESGEYYLEVEGTDKKGRPTLTRVYFYSTGSDWIKSGGGNDITLMPDRNTYKPGDTVKLMIQSPLPKGKYLLTIEREGILSEKVLNLEGGANVIDIPVDDSLVPVFYVAVSSYSKRTEDPPKSYNDPDLGKPKGYFGITKILVSTETREINLEIFASKPSYLPGEEAEFIIKATKDNKPVKNAELTFLAVDRGVIDLINYHVPDPLKYFYQDYRFPIGVKGGDSRHLLIDPVTYEMKDLYGGDSEDAKMKQRKDFSPTAVFEPFLLTDENGLAKVKCKLPDTLTTYRCTALAVKQSDFGIKESETIVQNPVNVRTALPRKLRIRDTSFAGVIITNLDNKEHEITVNFESDILEVDGDKTKTIKLKPSSIVEVPFKILATRVGVGKVTFTTKSDILNEKLIEDFTVEQPINKEAFATIGRTKDSKEEGLIIPSNIAPGYGEVQIKLDSTRLSTLAESINYLWDYPYGCLEQRSSKIFPLIVFGERLKDFTNVKDSKKIIEKELSEWAKYQNSDGGLPLWLENGQPSYYYVSIKVAKLLYYAKLNNFKIPDMLNIGALLNYISTKQEQYDYGKAYSLYVLSLHKKDVLVRAKDLLEKQGDKLGTGGLALLGLAFANGGNNDLAKECFTKLKNLIKIGTQSIDFVDTYERYYFDSDVSRLALLLMFYKNIGDESDMETRIINTLLSTQKAGYWYNTYSTEWVIQAFYEVYEKNNAGQTSFTAKVLLDNKELISKQFRGIEDQFVKNLLFENELKDFPKNKMIPLKFSKEGDGELFYTATIKYAIPSEVVRARDEGFSVFSEIYDMDGNKIEGKELKLGKTYKMKVAISSTKTRQFVAIRVPVPSGAEILDSSFVTTATYKDKSQKEENKDYYGYYDYYYDAPISKIYDNEVQYFYDYFSQGKKDLEFVFRTTSLGIYPTPPAYASCMYEEEVFGRNAGGLFVVKE